MSPRHHRWLTLPSGSLLLACLALPGFRDCGATRPMTTNALLIGICLVGGAAVICALALARRRAERWVAIAFIVLAGTSAGVLTVICAAVDRVYAGITMALTASVCVALGGLVWQREARGGFAAATLYVKVLAPLMVAAFAITAAVSTWHPPPDEDVVLPTWFPVVH